MPAASVTPTDREVQSRWCLEGFVHADVEASQRSGHNLANAVKCAAVRRCRSGVRADRWAESVLECPGSIAGRGRRIKGVAV